MPAPPFTVSVAGLLDEPGGRRRETRRGELPGLRVTGSSVPEGAEVAIEVELTRVESAIEARGTVEAPWVGECVRCLESASGTLRSPVREVFERDAVDGETYPLRGGEIDLAPLVRDTVLLELPQVPVCSEACLGLCPTCGADRNQGTCACPDEAIDPRWAGLDALRTAEDL